MRRCSMRSRRSSALHGSLRWSCIRVDLEWHHNSSGRRRDGERGGDSLRSARAAQIGCPCGERRAAEVFRRSRGRPTVGDTVAVTVVAGDGRCLPDPLTVPRLRSLLSRPADGHRAHLAASSPDPSRVVTVRRRSARNPPAELVERLRSNRKRFLWHP